MNAIKAYKTQFYNPDSKEEHETYISKPEFVHVIEARAREFGKHLGVAFGEGFISKKPLGVDNLFQLK